MSRLTSLASLHSCKGLCLQIHKLQSKCMDNVACIVYPASCTDPSRMSCLIRLCLSCKIIALGFFSHIEFADTAGAATINVPHQSLLGNFKKRRHRDFHHCKRAAHLKWLCPKEEGVIKVEPLAPSSFEEQLKQTLICFVLVDPAGKHHFCSRYDFGPWPLLPGVNALPEGVLTVISPSKRTMH